MLGAFFFNKKQRDLEQGKLVAFLKQRVNDLYNDIKVTYPEYAQTFLPEEEADNPKKAAEKLKNIWRTFRDHRSKRQLWTVGIDIEDEYLDKVEDVLNTTLSDGSGQEFVQIGGMDIPKASIKKQWFNGNQWCASVDGDSFDFPKFKDELLLSIRQEAKPLPTVTDYSSKTLLLFSLPDLHIGKRPFEEISKDVLAATANLFDRIDFSKKDYHILFVMGNDLLNTDSGYATTKGTPQFDYVEWAQSFKDAVVLVKSIIETLLQYATLDIINVPGNHDFKRAFYVGQVIQEYYKAGSIDADENPRKYYKFGKNLFGFDHGELKFSEYPLLMVRERPLDYAATDNWEWFLGHQHTEKVDEIKGFKVRFLPSLTRHVDEWHVRNGYIGNKRSAMIYKYDYEAGLIGTEVFTFKG